MKKTPCEKVPPKILVVLPIEKADGLCYTKAAIGGFSKIADVAV